ncbi:MAG: carbon-nitrogen hydrolase family protein [Chloroflexi bacterium]|nr:carbon-nitrogen hydrolase family protein [Chloroflexota bacterium]
MKVTVCESSDPLQEAEWSRLVEHVANAQSELVLLPEMPFSPWIAATKPFATEKWEAAVEAHSSWLKRMSDLAPALVLSSRPVAQRRNEGFIWDEESGYRPVHDKYYLPDEAGFWEATWYARGDLDFSVAQAGAARMGFAICTEIWFTEHARAYARQGIHLLACPRATERSTVDKWIAGGRAAAVMAGAFCLSSNRSGEGSGLDWGGNAWIIDPDGQVLGLTSREDPFITLDLNLEQAEAAKSTYPRYVSE